MIRLFVGLELPDDVKDRLLTLHYGLEGARWQRADQLHLTLRFIGEVDFRTAGHIQDDLNQITFDPFDVQLAGLGVFGKVSHPRMLYAAVANPDPLVHLHKKIDQVLDRVGLPPETRKFTPHVTLARFKGKRCMRLEPYLAARSLALLPRFEVTQFVLFASHLCQDGARYEVLADYPAEGWADMADEEDEWDLYAEVGEDGLYRRAVSSAERTYVK